MNARALFRAHLDALPLVAILRGLPAAQAEEAADALLEHGFRLIEVPLNSPRPLDSIATIAAAAGNRALVGAGTVTAVGQVAEVAAAGGRLIVSPHVDAAVLAAAKARDLAVMPGVFTPSEAFAALAAGADALKLFPAEAAPPPVVKALKAVLPPGTPLLPTGGISTETMADYWAAGADGFGLGGALYRPGRPLLELSLAARSFAATAQRLRRAGSTAG